MKRPHFLGAVAGAAVAPLAAGAAETPPPSASAVPATARTPSPSPVPRPPPSPAVFDAFRAAALPIAVAGGRLTGTGFDRIYESLRGAQFVGVGEEHNNADVDLFVGALYATLTETFGFRHAAVETDALFGRMVSARGVVGDAEAVAALARRYPMAATFCGDEELALLAAFGRLSDARTDRVWGLDQIFGVRHVLDRLLPYAPDRAARAATTEILAAAEPYETTRFGRGTHLLATQPLPPAFDRLRELYRAIPGSEAAWLIDQLLLSRSVFVRNGLNDGWLASNRDREQNMKTLFSFKYREALAAGETLPKVLWKAGHVHASRTYQRTGVFPTGSFLAELATFNGARYFNLAVALREYDPMDTSVAYLAPLQAAGRADGWTYVDLTQVLRWWAASPESVDPQLRDLFQGFDAAIVFPKRRRVARTVVPA